MTHIKYSLVIYEKKSNKFHELHDLDSLPRFQIGDEFDYHFFDNTCDIGWRAIVSDAFYIFGGDREHPELTLRLEIREESASAQADRQRKRSQ